LEKRKSMKKENNTKELLLCDCNSIDHQISFFYDYDEERTNEGDIIKRFPLCYANIHLKKLPFLKRLKNGLLYILGRKSKYGDFDEFIFNPNDAPKLQKLVDHLKSCDHDNIIIKNNNGLLDLPKTFLNPLLQILENKKSDVYIDMINNLKFNSIYLEKDGYQITIQNIEHLNEIEKELKEKNKYKSYEK